MIDGKYYEKLDEIGVVIQESWTREVRKYLGGLFKSVKAGLDNEEEVVSDELQMIVDYAEEGKPKEAGMMVTRLKHDAKVAGFRISGLEKVLGFAHNNAIRGAGKK